MFSTFSHLSADSGESDDISTPSALDLDDFTFSDQPPASFMPEAKLTTIPDQYVHWHEISRTLLNKLFESVTLAEAQLETLKFLLGPALLPVKCQTSDNKAAAITIINDYKALAMRVLSNNPFIKQHYDQLIIKPNTEKQLIENIIGYKSEIMTCYTDREWIQGIYDAIMRVENTSLKLKMRLELNKHALTQRMSSLELHLQHFDSATSEFKLNLAAKKKSSFQAYHDQLSKMIAEPLEWAELRLALTYLPNSGNALQSLQQALHAYIDERDTLYWKPWLQSCFFVQDKVSLNRRRHVEYLISFMYVAARNDHELNDNFKAYFKNGISLIIKLIDYEDGLHAANGGLLTYSKFRSLLENFVATELAPVLTDKPKRISVVPMELTTFGIFTPEPMPARLISPPLLSLSTSNTVG
jgi:hypothetical protein